MSGLRFLKESRIFAALLLALLLNSWNTSSVQASTTFGRWRDINPTDYSSDVGGTLRGVFIRIGGWGAIGAGDGWAVGGDFAGTPQAVGIIAHYDGFSWQLYPPPDSRSVYYSVNFCRPGSLTVGPLCPPNADGSDGWMVGSSLAGPAATYWTGSGLMEARNGLALANVRNLTSVFMVCHSPGFALGCSGPFAAGGLTYAAGQALTASGPHGVVCNFHGSPRAAGGWTCPFISSGIGNTQYNGLNMFVERTGGVGWLGGFAVGTNGWIARLSYGAWTESQIAPGVTFRSVFVDQGGDTLDAWAVGDSYSSGAQIWHFCCGPAGTWQGPVSPTATDQNLENVFLVSPTEGWAVGSQSVILHSTTLGSTNVWMALTRPIQTATGAGVDLIGLSFPYGGNGWAVGSSGTIIDTQNSECDNAVVSPCWGGSTAITRSANLTTVFELNRNDAWAGGYWDFSNGPQAGANLIHWDGRKWHRAEIFPPPQLRGNPFNVTSIYMSSSTDGWAVGGEACPATLPLYFCSGPAPKIPFVMHWDGSSWSGAPTTQPVCNCALSSVFMIDTGEGWAVGDGGEFFHYTSDLNQWVLVQKVPTHLNSVFISNPGSNQNAGWAVGSDGDIYELSISASTATWTLVKAPALQGATPTLHSVFFADADHGWIVGVKGTILETTNGGKSWIGGQGQVVGAPGATLRSVYVDNSNSGSGSGDGWAVGGSEESSLSSHAVFAHWNGQTWTAIVVSPPVGTFSLNSVFAKGPQDGWAVGTSSSVPSGQDGIFHLDPLNPPTSIGPSGNGETASTLLAFPYWTDTVFLRWIPILSMDAPAHQELDPFIYEQ